MLNEAAVIERTLAALAPMRSRGVQVVVADGGSSDASVAIARRLADVVIEAPRGRAAQMNAGAAVANGGVLWFLHADTLPPPDADHAILGSLRLDGAAARRADDGHPLSPGGRELGSGGMDHPLSPEGRELGSGGCDHPLSLEGRGLGRGGSDHPLSSEGRGLGRGDVWGRFDVSITGAGLLLRIVATMMNLRSRATGIATGDQGLFMTRSAFDKVGGFPPIPLMEDIAISRALKRLSRPVCLRIRLATSGRRWKRHGVVRTILLMWRLRAAYFFGADPARLALLYRDR